MKALGICSSFAIVSFECPFDEARQTGRGAPDGGEDGGCGAAAPGGGRFVAALAWWLGFAWRLT